jgi:hypothetical protein
MNQFRVLSFKAYQKNTLQGFLDLVTDSGLIIHGCSLHQKNDSRWIGLPSKEYTKNDNTKGWQPIVEFATKEAGYAFRDKAIEALDRFQGHGERSGGRNFDGDF